MKKLVFTLMAIVLLLSLAPISLGYDCMTYLYGGNTKTYLERVKRTGKNITVAAPDYFEVSSEGTLKYSKSVDPLLLASLHDDDITVLPFLSNHWNRENARKMLKDRVNMANSLAQAVMLHNLDGLDIDIQNITAPDKDEFTDFIRLLRQELPAGKILTVCVPANPYNTTAGWQGGYDYAALAKYCDHIFIMTYDESFDGGPPGPVASFSFIEKSIQYGLKYVSRDKLMIGIPFYGRFWTDTVKGAAFTCADINWLIQNCESVIWYDETHDCARATVTVPLGTTVTTWGGRKVYGGVYDIWYENERSYEKKLGLVCQYGLKGVGAWALGQEDGGIWGNFSKWLRGSIFEDIEGHWAQSYIVELKEKGLVSGRDDRHYAPESHLTRAEACALFVRLAGLAESDDTKFSDSEGHWAAGYINSAFENGLVTGITDDKFEPDRLITREEFAVIADRYTSLNDTFDMTNSVFTDLTDANAWSLKSIIKMYINGVISGYPDGAFRPGNYITRAETAKMLQLTSGLPTRFLGSKTIPAERKHMSPR